VQGAQDVIDLLNEVLATELTAVNQYFLGARLCESWGYERLGKHFYDESIDEMKDADELIKRILFLEGMPNLQRLLAIRIGETPQEQLQLALEDELGAVTRLNAGIALCTAQGDNGTLAVLAEILEGEEAHADWLETQLRLIEELGETIYLSQQTGS
jgi:bacterioferritin